MLWTVCKIKLGAEGGQKRDGGEIKMIKFFPNKKIKLI